MTDTLSIAEQFVRDALFAATEPIRDEEVAGLLFGIGLVASDHVFNVLRRVWFL